MISFESFKCPNCGAFMALTDDKRSLVCNGGQKKHCFDISSSGYVNFAPPSQSASGDSKEAVRSRTRFLESEGYKPISDAVTEAVLKYCKGGLVVDAGCGEGYYTNNIAENFCGNVVGIDLSKFGVEYAAKKAKRRKITNSFFAVGSVYSIPLFDESADAVVNIFAPCAEEEYLRILKKGGVLIVAGAGEDHLLGLKKAVYDDIYKNTERRDYPQSMTFCEERQISFCLTLDGKEKIFDLFSMTPYYYRTGGKDMKKLESLEQLETEIDVTVKIYRK